jgi:hypothetical protein
MVELCRRDYSGYEYIMVLVLIGRHFVFLSDVIILVQNYHHHVKEEGRISGICRWNCADRTIGYEDVKGLMLSGRHLGFLSDIIILVQNYHHHVKEEGRISGVCR